MDIIKVSLDAIVHAIWSFPEMLRVFFLRMLISLALVYLFTRRVWERTLGIKALQISIAILLVFLTFRIPTSFFILLISKMSPGVYCFFFIVSSLCMIFMPKAVSFYIVPKTGYQMILSKFLYFIEVLLLIIQIAAAK